MNYFILFMASVGVAIIHSMMELRTLNSIESVAGLLGSSTGLFVIPVIIVFIGGSIDGSIINKEARNKWMYTWVIWGILSTLATVVVYAENVEHLSESSTGSHSKNAANRTEYLIYTFDDLYKAVFPGPPILEVDAEQENTRFRSYSYTDETNLIVYTASSVKEKNTLTNIDISDAINNFIKGDAHSVGGTISYQEEANINGSLGSYFLINYQVNGRTVRKCSAVTYINGNFFTWSVQDIPSVSKLNAVEIFNAYVENFSVADSTTTF